MFNNVMFGMEGRPIWKEWKSTEHRNYKALKGGKGNSTGDNG